jgi:hypothetical protein
LFPWRIAILASNWRAQRSQRLDLDMPDKACIPEATGPEIEQGK